MMPEPEENRLDQSLRDKFEDFDLTPSAGVWAGVEQRLVAEPTPALRRRRRPLPLPFLVGLTALLAGLGGWLLPHGAAMVEPSKVVRYGAAARNSTTAAELPQATNKAKVVEPTRNSSKSNPYLAKLNPTLAKSGPNSVKSSPTLAKSNPNSVKSSPYVVKSGPTLAKSNPTTAKSSSTLALLSTKTPHSSSALANPTAVALVAGLPHEAVLAQPLARPADNPAPAADSVPATLRPLAALERQTLGQLPSIATLAPGYLPADSRTALLTTLRTERAELFRLQRRTDSLLLALGDLPGVPLAAPAVAAAPAADTAKPRPLAHRWSLLLTATPEQNTLNLQGPETDSLTALRRNHETGRAGLSAALTAEYKLTPRLSVGGGVGYTSFGADLRITNKITDVRVRYDTTVTRTTSVYTSVNQTHSIRIIQVPQLSPVFNASGQVIRYDTVYVPRQDTVYTTTVQHDTTHTTNNSITPHITKKETLVTKHLQPTYRFFTVPVLLRYRLTMGPGRWWADVAAGAQFQFFLGGTQVATEDGVNFRTETITAGNGPFRPLNLALSGSLALNYALTNRLSVSVAPSLRWQALSVYKPETGLIQQPTATGLMFGVRFGL
ncbi:hypothetical protein [Hymenobacter terricola]|uniref:hypothetical protein n=1 Tax=Hymenobacter terricola TaxID=2819236 RepID=UPI001B303024|nr:hypothetical protein [Hymenobacter terricola]